MELAQRTGVPWSSMYSHGKVKFNAYVEFNESPVEDPKIEEAVLEAMNSLLATHAFRATTMLELSEVTGFELRELMPVLDAMIRKGSIRFSIDRMGKAVWFWRE